ncbi:MAG: hypothetical protein FJX64_01975 [Alphaproteobacteria bacterium]|nr:hypothetical protein [Alphaproteobacteria bacterium]
MPANAPLQACFRWRIDGAAFQPGPSPRIVERLADGRGLVIAARVPELPATADARVKGPARLAEIRIILGEGTAADVTALVGITWNWPAYVAALATVLLILLIAYAIKWDRGWRGSGLLLLIGTGKGTASLSQFQIVLWTAVVGASVVYVNMLSGTLIPITNGTLGLLGISALATLGSQLHAKEEQAKVTAVAAAAGPPVPAAAAPAPATLVGPPRVPKLSDLVMSLEDGIEVIDVTRVQMLFFAVIIALFVAIKVFAGYVIPDIPAEYLGLMGISNGVFVAAKWTRPPNP